jgi:small conductance mechanosensitive channel
MARRVRRPAHGRIWRLSLLALIGAAALAPAVAGAPAPAPLSAASDPVVATPADGLGGFLSWLFHLSAGNVRERGLRIGIILLVGVGAKYAMDLVQRFSHWFVQSNWGLLRYSGRNRQRSLTIHSLLINLARYVIYFTAVGYILSELGIDYRAYLASLSLIGVAVGFGAQGLVQDVVTGFFVLFEDQFAVGDMVEISDHVGLVEAIGLRTTRVRSYQGAEITLPNRNITVAARFPAGAVEAGVDLALADEADPQAAIQIVSRTAVEVERQFEGIFRVAPAGCVRLQLATGESFVRLRALVWPREQWVIDEQVVPRLREQLTAAGIRLAGDRVAVFYHFPSQDEPDASLLTRLLNRGHMPSAAPRPG